MQCFGDAGLEVKVGNHRKKKKKNKKDGSQWLCPFLINPEGSAQINLHLEPPERTKNGREKAPAAKGPELKDCQGGERKEKSKAEAQIIFCSSGIPDLNPLISSWLLLEIFNSTSIKNCL